MNKTLSNRSMAPPWPGMMLPKSLMPYWRLITEAERSPSTPSRVAKGVTSATAGMLMVTAFLIYPQGTTQLQKAWNTRQTRTFPMTAVTIPPIRPSTVFLGLMRGQSLCLPRKVPTK